MKQRSVIFGGVTALFLGTSVSTPAFTCPVGDAAVGALTGCGTFVGNFQAGPPGGIALGFTTGLVSSVMHGLYHGRHPFQDSVVAEPHRIPTVPSLPPIPDMQLRSGSFGGGGFGGGGFGGGGSGKGDMTIRITVEAL